MGYSWCESLPLARCKRSAAAELHIRGLIPLSGSTGKSNHPAISRVMLWRSLSAGRSRTISAARLNIHSDGHITTFRATTPSVPVPSGSSRSPRITMIYRESGHAPTTIEGIASTCLEVCIPQNTWTSGSGCSRVQALPTRKPPGATTTTLVLLMPARVVCLATLFKDQVLRNWIFAGSISSNCKRRRKARASRLAWMHST